MQSTDQTEDNGTLQEERKEEKMEVSQDEEDEVKSPPLKQQRRN